jgi:hypothetical protein
MVWWMPECAPRGDRPGHQRYSYKDGSLEALKRVPRDTKKRSSVNLIGGNQRH